MQKFKKFFEGPPRGKDDKKVTIEGPMGGNRWTWVVESGLYSVGLESAIHFYDCPEPLSRISNRMHNLLIKMGLPGTFVDWKTMSNYRVWEMVKKNKTPLVLSLQGLVDQKTVQDIRELHPLVRIIYWWGPPVKREDQIQRIMEMDGVVDVLGLSFKKDVERLRSRSARNVVHLPFAACPYHHNLKVNTTSRTRRKYGRDVVLIAPFGEYEEELIRRISEALGQKVDVWGPGWSDNQWVRSNGLIFTPRNLEAYASSTIVLNPHGHDFMEHNGLNPAFFEIPAAGGFQITEDQPILQEKAFGEHVVTFRDSRELADKVRYYLHDQGARETLRTRLQNHILEKETYGHRFYHLFDSMQISG